MLNNTGERLHPWFINNGTPPEQVIVFKYLGYCISEYKSDLEDKLQTYYKIN